MANISKTDENIHNQTSTFIDRDSSHVWRKKWG